MQKVSEMNEIEELTVPASPGDAGSSLGAAFMVIWFICFFPEFELFPDKYYNENIQSDIFTEVFQKSRLLTE